ncbi:SRPBCC family protein [Micropruina sonneratiae]|uniref:SRPBCC family protein n=1 Tax=Micropruina sonneratiae TaxID=2986940 RepID=UPI0022269841|nr:SRPBCC domain-containing protein [Micropruina sp. KQZ13P-5]MCW3158870.1 SRPBCC domain-containing protein [Micropruina sp. KQZ13P-5]
MTDQSASDLLEASRDTTVVVQRSVSQPVKEVWRLLATPAGSEALLGEGGVLGDKGDSWQSADGTFGVVRSYHPLEQIRFSWHADSDAPKSLVDLHLVKESDDSTVLEIRHENIPDGLDVAAITQHWEQALDRIAAAN